MFCGRVEKAKQYKGLDNKFAAFICVFYYAIYLYAKFIIKGHMIFAGQFMLILWSNSIDIDIWSIDIYVSVS